MASQPGSPSSGRASWRSSSEAAPLVAIRVRWLRLLIGALGLWLVASPFVFEEARPETVNLIALGGVVLVLALVSLAVDQEGARESRG